MAKTPTSNIEKALSGGGPNEVPLDMKEVIKLADAEKIEFDVMQNLIDAPEHQERIQKFANDIYTWLEDTDGMQIPLKNIARPKFGDHRNQDVL